MLRVEDKYDLPLGEFADLDARMRALLPADSNEADAQGYTVSSLYFDDYWDTDYRDALSGNAFRTKYRIRIYNHSLSRIKLEVKRKCYSRIGKISCTISADEMRSLIQGDPIAWGANADDPRSLFNLRILNRGLRPRVIVTYERKAYLYESGNTRITFDRNIRASNAIEHFGDADLVYDPVIGTDRILEVKYDEFQPDFIRQALESDSMSLSSCSKYRLCREVYM